MTVLLGYTNQTKENLVKQHDIIRQTLSEHGVSVRYVHSNVGPTITQHAFELRPGNRVSSLTKLNEDVALALGLTSVRVLVPIPGTSHVGYEVPSDVRETVDYRETCMTDPDPDHALSIPLGVTPSGTVEFMDLTKAPHLLIAGQTGSGKSVALSTMLTYMIQHYSDADLELYLVDPKRVELVSFVDAPHVVAHAVDLVDAVDILEDLTRIMDYRYEVFRQARVRNIAEYLNTGQHMDRKVLIVDELADLMLTSNRTIEPMIVRLTQLARAAGIHVVLATQRPTVNVVTGLIKANVPTRWTFSVASSVDSKVILDETGAESLYGAGDALVGLIGSDTPMRVQGIFTPDEVIQYVVDEANLTDVVDDNEEGYYHPEEDTVVEPEPIITEERINHILTVARPDSTLPKSFRGRIVL